MGAAAGAWILAPPTAKTAILAGSAVPVAAVSSAIETVSASVPFRSPPRTAPRVMDPASEAKIVESCCRSVRAAVGDVYLPPSSGEGLDALRFSCS